MCGLKVFDTKFHQCVVHHDVQLVVETTQSVWTERDRHKVSPMCCAPRRPTCCADNTICVD